MDEQKRDFKGVWIPAEVWLDKRLSALDKMIYAEIDSLNADSGCYASNEYLADFCQCSEAKITKALSVLKSVGLVSVKSFDGRKRVLVTAIPAKMKRQSSKIYEADSEKLLGRVVKNTRQSSKKYEEDYSSIDTNIDTKLVTNPPIVPPKGDDACDEFDVFWKAYPKKVGKGDARKAFKKIKGVKLQTLLDAIEKQKRSAQWKRDNGQYIPNPSTWLNQERWDDELKEGSDLVAVKRVSGNAGLYSDEFIAEQIAKIHYDV